MQNRGKLDLKLTDISPETGILVENQLEDGTERLNPERQMEKGICKFYIDKF